MARTLKEAIWKSIPCIHEGIIVQPRSTAQAQLVLLWDQDVVCSEVRPRDFASPAQPEGDHPAPTLSQQQALGTSRIERVHCPQTYVRDGRAPYMGARIKVARGYALSSADPSHASYAAVYAATHQHATREDSCNT